MPNKMHDRIYASLKSRIPEILQLTRTNSSEFDFQSMDIDFFIPDRKSADMLLNGVIEDFPDLVPVGVRAHYGGIRINFLSPEGTYYLGPDLIWDFPGLSRQLRKQVFENLQDQGRFAINNTEKLVEALRLEKRKGKEVNYRKFLHPDYVVKRFFDLCLTKTRPLKNPKLIVFMGADGSGKSTVIREISKHFDLLAVKHRVYHTSPKFRTRPHKSSNIAPFTKRPYGKLVSAFKLLKLVGDTAMLRFALLRAHLFNETLILDRSFLDFVASPQRARLAFSRDIMQKFACWIFPRPTVIVNLAGDPEMISKRKGELSAGQIITAQRETRLVIESLGVRSIEIDAGMPVLEIRDLAIRSAFSKRTPTKKK